MNMNKFALLFLFLTTLSAAALFGACSSDDGEQTKPDGDVELTYDIDIEHSAEDEELPELDTEAETVSEAPDEDFDEADLYEEDGDFIEVEEEEESVEEEVEPDAEDGPMRCNGFVELCDRHFNEVAYVTTHNSMSNSDDNWIAPNQIHNIQTQLSDGVRGFMLDTYIYKDEVWLCHGDCRYGKKLLLEALEEMKSFLDANPHDIITIIFESYVTPAEAEAVFVAAGLTDYVFVPTEDMNQWPTLGEMIGSNERLIVFTSPWDVSAPAWYLNEWAYCWETPWHVTALDDFDCSINLGAQDNGVFILNHFLYGAYDMPSQAMSAEANANPFLYDRAAGCLEETGHMPNFITVNHYSLGDVFEAVRQLNAVD